MTTTSMNKEMTKLVSLIAKADIPFKTGMHMTEKDRPRDKIYKKWNEKDDEANDSNNN